MKLFLKIFVKFIFFVFPVETDVKVEAESDGTHSVNIFKYTRNV